MSIKKNKKKRNLKEITKKISESLKANIKLHRHVTHDYYIIKCYDMQMFYIHEYKP